MQTIQRELNSRVTREQGGDVEDTRALDVLKDVFVCVSIPIIVYAFAYVTLRAVLGLFLS